MNIIEATRESLRVGRGMSRPTLYEDAGALLHPRTSPGRDSYLLVAESGYRDGWRLRVSDILAEDWFVRGADTTTLRPSEVDDGQA